MTRVLFTHSYSMTQVRALCELGEYPRHHLWGADALERAGFDVRYGFFGRYRRTLRRLSESLGGRLGDIEQEAAMWRAARGHTVVYAAEANVVRGLTALRRAGWRVPVVAIVHGGGRWAAGLDVAVCLTSRMREHLVRDLGRDPALTPLVPWGPDLTFGLYRSTGDDLV